MLGCVESPRSFRPVCGCCLSVQRSNTEKQEMRHYYTTQQCQRILLSCFRNRMSGSEESIDHNTLATMEENVLRRFYNNVLAIIREISVEPAYLGFSLSWGLCAIVSSELYISKVRTMEHHFVEHALKFVLEACFLMPQKCTLL